MRVVFDNQERLLLVSECLSDRVVLNELLRQYVTSGARYGEGGNLEALTIPLALLSTTEGIVREIGDASVWGGEPFYTISFWDAE